MHEVGTSIVATGALAHAPATTANLTISPGGPNQPKCTLSICRLRHRACELPA